MTDADRAMLELEKVRWKFPGAKDAEIRRQFECSPARYYQRLNQLIDQPDAIAAEPMVVRRLQRLRETRRRRRTGAGHGVG